MTELLIGAGVVAAAASYAWGRHSASGEVKVIELRVGGGGYRSVGDNWRWFGLDASGRTVCSGMPMRYLSEHEARDAAARAYPGVPCRREMA